MGFGKDGKGVIISELREQAIGSLGANTGIIIGTKLALATRFRMLKVELTATLVDMTASEGLALQVYLADGNLTLVEFEAAIEQNGPISANQIAEGEKAMRPTWLMGAGPAHLNNPVAADGFMMVNGSGGPLLEAKPRWTFGIGNSWNWLVYNGGKAITTGSTMKIKSKVYGVWVT